jgi:hypothetical protein
MRVKIIFIIIITAAVTTVLVSNTGEMELWLFGTYKFSKLAVMATMLAIGFLLGLIVRPGSSSRKQKELDEYNRNGQGDFEEPEAPYLKKTTNLSDEDRDYIS